MQLFTKERVVLVGLCAHAETIKTFAPEVLKASDDGGGTVDGKALVTKLFGYPPSEKLAAWIKGGLFSLLLPPTEQEPLGSVSDAVRMVARSMIHNRKIPEQDVKREKFHVLASDFANGQKKIFLVIVGQLSNPPKGMTTVSIG